MRSLVAPTLAGFFFSFQLFPLSLATGAELGDPSRVIKGVAPASDEGERAMKAFQLPKGLAVELIAAEPLLANPVAFSIDERGRFYVVETFRHGAGVLDIRGRRGWPGAEFREGIARDRLQNLGSEVLDADLAVRSVDDRVAYLKSYFGNNARSLSGESDRIRLIWDSKHDGKPDKSTVFADGFARAEDGIASGVISRHGEVWFTNIPDLWWLRDRDGDGVADERRSLRHGFGVRSGFLGHDLHGLTFGPDGRLYFTIGDRAAAVPIEGGAELNVLNSGAVFRCNPDGTEMEIFATGLRNPEELTFDQHGNLFTGDNNSDGGDQARWVHLVEGGDSGWRIGYQFQEGSDGIYGRQARGPWNAEKMWHEQHADQPAFLVPPVAILANGPSGVSFYPGTGLAESWNGRFFLVDFKGQQSVSGVHTFSLVPNGAGFKIGQRENFIWNILATDIAFGVEGGLYVLDWVQGWSTTGKGRIYRVYDPGLKGNPRVAETKRLLGEGMANRSIRELGRLLGQQDYRVRLDAQFELVRRGDDGLHELINAARQTKVHLARLHGVWGTGQLLHQFRGQVTAFRTRTEAVETLIQLLKDADHQVRAQSVKALGDARAPEAFAGLVPLAADPEARVRFEAVVALGKLGRLEAVPAIVAMLKKNEDADPLLRHAGVMALTALNDRATLITAAKDPSVGVRMASLIAMRRLKFDDIGQFLDDSEPRIVREAARAINDGPVEGATLALASHQPKDWNDPVLAARVISANLRAGTATHARRLAELGADGRMPEPAREDALLALGEWGNPSGRDRVTGNWRPLIASSRDGAVPAAAVTPLVAALLGQNAERIQLAALRVVTGLKLRAAAPSVSALVGSKDAASRVRIAALNTLENIDARELGGALETASISGDDRLQSAAASIRARSGMGDVVAQIQSTLKSGSTHAKQEAIRSLVDVKSEAADKLLLSLLDGLKSGEQPVELGVDILDSAVSRQKGLFAELVKTVEAGDGGPLAPYRFAVAGGNAEAGRRLFHEREDVACLRCHQVGGTGGEVGPKMDGIAVRATADYLLESIVTPNAKIAPGFEGVMIETKDGPWVSGVIKSENERQVVINSPEDGLVTIPLGNIKSRQRGASGMPEGMGQILSRHELRDVFAYLSTLR